MNRAMMMCAAFVLMLATSARAEDAKTDKEAPKEWSGSTGCAKCQFSKQTEAKECSPAIKVGETVYVLKGDALKKEMPGCCGKKGEYTVKGTLSEDKKSIEVTEIKSK
jgi:hypothetical protein